MFFFDDMNLILKAFTKVLKRLENLQNKNLKRVEVNSGKITQLKDEVFVIEKNNETLLQENERAGRIIQRIQDLVD